ncbi:component of SufBCD complex [Roseicyclus marinus]|uniref:component of SufBCD complex n=1 Tax=Roseicyclus marinus TaxID=2161673 RepID=UPI00240ECC61|nr:component of SufBCD complex [Roseicyclus marinus]MDG3039932.1 component of SufBCD complex [Roseicyclus marinus]
MDFFDLVTQVIGLRSFSNLWYWIVLAILWSTLSHWVLGIPYDLVQRARAGDADSQRDVEALAVISCRRILNLAEVSGIAMVALSAFVVTSLAVLGWVYRVEFCQALVLLLLPLLAVTGLSIHTARGLVDSGFEDLAPRLRRHRLMVQGMGVMFIFLTAFWGMYVNLSVSRLY